MRRSGRERFSAAKALAWQTISAVVRATGCGRPVETLPALQHDPNRPEDVLKVDADEDGVGGETWRSVTYGGWASQACDEMDAPIYSLREP